MKSSTLTLLFMFLLTVLIATVSANDSKNLRLLRSFSLNNRGTSFTVPPTDYVNTFYPGDYLGDINGYHAILQEDCNFVFYNGDEVIWKATEDSYYSPSEWIDDYHTCKLNLYPQGDMLLIWPADGDPEDIVIKWNSNTIRFGNTPETTELRIEDEELLFIHIFRDGKQKIFNTARNYVFWEKIPSHPLSDITLNFFDKTDLTIERNSYFGVLNEIYAILQPDCNLILYNGADTIWETNTDDGPQAECKLVLQRNGNLVLYYIKGSTKTVKWESRTKNYPVSSQLKVEGEKLKLIQTFHDGSQRVFSSKEGTSQLWEDISLKIIGEDSFTVDHADQDTIIFRRNEYMGDLNGEHIVLQPDCKFILYNGDQVLWSSDPSYPINTECVVLLQKDDAIVISNGEDEPILTDGNSLDGRIIIRPTEAKLIQTELRLEGKELVFYQTYTDSSERTFYTFFNQEGGLSTIKERLGSLRRIAETSVIANSPDSPFIIQKLEYIGDLSGMHVILQEDCNFVFYNGDQYLWSSQTSQVLNLDCSVTLRNIGELFVYGNYSSTSDYRVGIIYRDDYTLPISTELAIKDEGLFLIMTYSDGYVRTFYSIDARVHIGTGFLEIDEPFKQISLAKLTVTPNDEGDVFLRRNEYIGDLNGIHAIFQQDCNFVVYNGSQVLYSAGSEGSHFSFCYLTLTREGILQVIVESGFTFWQDWIVDAYSQVQYPPIDPNRRIPDKTELILETGGELKLVYTYTDGTYGKYKTSANSFMSVFMLD